MRELLFVGLELLTRSLLLKDTGKVCVGGGCDVHPLQHSCAPVCMLTSCLFLLEGSSACMPMNLLINEHIHILRVSYFKASDLDHPDRIEKVLNFSIAKTSWSKPNRGGCRNIRTVGSLL